MLFCWLLPLLLLLASADLGLTSAAGVTELEVSGAARLQKRAHLCGGQLTNAIRDLCYQRRRRGSFGERSPVAYLEDRQGRTRKKLEEKFC